MTAMALGLTIIGIGAAALVLCGAILLLLDLDAWRARRDAELRRLTAPIPPERPIDAVSDDEPGFPVELCPSGRHRTGVAAGSSAQRERWTCMTSELELLVTDGRAEVTR